MSTQPKRTQEELFFPLKAMPQGNHRKRPVLLLSSVKGGSGKTYSALSMALGITRILNQKIKSEENNTSKVCVIDLDLSATNMCALLETANDDLASGYIQFEQKKSIHEYILHAVNRSIDLSQYISKLTYTPLSEEPEQKYAVDLIVGSQNPQFSQLFSPTRISNYENGVLESEARILLFRMFDAVVRRGYQAIIIDMQPGMEGLCHAAIEYWTSCRGNIYNKKGFFDKDIIKQFEQYELHLCLNSTGDRTQIISNMLWMMDQIEILHAINNIHMIIKDNFNAYEFASPNEIEASLVSLINVLTKSKYSYGESKELISSVLVMRNNEKYREFFGLNDPSSRSMVYLEDLFLKWIFASVKYKKSRRKKWIPETESWIKQFLLL